MIFNKTKFSNLTFNWKHFINRENVKMLKKIVLKAYSCKEAPSTFSFDVDGAALQGHTLN